MLPSTGLRDPGSILLISCYELGHQPLGLAWPLAFLEREGFSPAALDIAVEPLDPDRVAGVRFVGISTPMHTALRLGVRAAERIRALNPACHICFYGLYAWLNADTLLGAAADSVIGGEYEGPLVALVNALDAGRAGPVEGVVRPGAAAPPSLARLPFPVPTRAGLAPLSSYVQLLDDRGKRPAGYVEASRGCLHLCRHCPIPPVYGGRFTVVPADVVLADIRALARAGTTHVTFGDPDFLNGPGHAMKIVRAMHSELPNLTFDVTTKVEHILKHRALFPELADLGCLFAVSAVESLSDAVLGRLDKGHTRADVFEALRIIRGAGISLRPSLLPFTPWSTLDDYRDLLGFIETEDLVDEVDPVQLSIRLLVPPGSLLAKSEAMRPHLGPLDAPNFMHRWKHPDPRMDELQAQVSRLVERAAKDNASPEHTLRDIRTVAAEIDREYPIHNPKPETLRLVTPPGATRSGQARNPKPTRRRTPRLTEPWFC